MFIPTMRADHGLCEYFRQDEEDGFVKITIPKNGG